MQVIQKNQYQKMNWKNGFGKTNEIICFPSQEKFIFRLSQACIQQNCEFSKYAGYKRLLTVISGSGLLLNGKKIEPLGVHSFSGDEFVRCELIDQEVQDLGFIYDPKIINAKMYVIRSFKKEEILKKCDLIYLYLLQGELSFGQLALRVGDTLELQKIDQEILIRNEIKTSEQLQAILIEIERL